MSNIDTDIEKELEYIKDALDEMYDTEDLMELRRLRMDVWESLRLYYFLNCERLGCEGGK